MSVKLNECWNEIFTQISAPGFYLLLLKIPHIKFLFWKIVKKKLNTYLFSV